MPQPRATAGCTATIPTAFSSCWTRTPLPAATGWNGFLVRMQGLIPAGMSLELVLLKQCVQLDWHTYLGINLARGQHVPAVIDENVTIHYDTTIGGATT